MAATARTRQRRTLDIWPGFVDALATLLIIIIFTLMIFVVAQFYLTDALSGRDKALTRLNQQIAELSEMLSLERRESDELRRSLDDISAELQATLGARDALSAQVAQLQTDLAAATERSEERARRLVERETALADRERELERIRQSLATSEASLAQTRQALAETSGKLTESERARAETERALAERGAALKARGSELEQERRLSKQAQDTVDLLNRQIAALRQQLAAIEEALQAEEAKVKNKDVAIENLSQRLNVALVSRVQRLEQYRSEFFGRVREVLGKRSDVQIVGDRFVFQSEVLFDTASAELEPAGREQIARLATTLKEIAEKIPSDIDWVLRVDGHTDKRPIVTPAYPSNWELSTARALSVVKFLIERGIPPTRLAATGFGEFQPLDDGESEEALRRNRRIELKFDQR